MLPPKVSKNCWNLTAVTNLLLWASKFATAKIECIFEMGKQTPLGGTIYFAGDGTCEFLTPNKQKHVLIFVNRINELSWLSSVPYYLFICWHWGTLWFCLSRVTKNPGCLFTATPFLAGNTGNAPPPPPPTTASKDPLIRHLEGGGGLLLWVSKVMTLTNFSTDGFIRGSNMLTWRTQSLKVK